MTVRDYADADWPQVWPTIEHVVRAGVVDPIRWAHESACAAMEFNAVVATNKSAVRLYETLGIMHLDP